jgi:hypothetical protein
VHLEGPHRVDVARADQHVRGAANLRVVRLGAVVDALVAFDALVADDDATGDGQRLLAAA